MATAGSNLVSPTWGGGGSREGKLAPNNAGPVMPISAEAIKATARRVRDLQKALKAMERRARATLLEREAERKQKAKEAA